MALVSLNTIKNWFKTNLIPNQNQWWDVFDSFRHKSDKVASTDIDGLDNLLAAKASTSVLTTHTTAESAHAALFGQKVDKIAGKVLSDQNYSLPEKEKLAGLEAFVAAQIAGAVVGSTSLGSITPASTIPATINVHGFAAAAGTYANCGNMVVPVNSIAFLSRVGGVWTVSATAFDVSGKVNVADVINTLTSTDSTKPSSADAVRRVNEKAEKSLAVTNDIKNKEENGHYFTDKFGNVMLVVEADGAKCTAYQIINPITKEVVVTLNKSWYDALIATLSSSSEITGIKTLLKPDGFYFTDVVGNVIAKITANGFQAIKFLDKTGEELGSAPRKLEGKTVVSIGDSHASAPWLDKFCELTGSTKNNTIQNYIRDNQYNYNDSGIMMGISKALNQYSIDNTFVPDVILIENCHYKVDGVKPITDYVPMIYDNLEVYGTTYSSYTAMLSTINSDRSSFIASLTPKVKTALRFNFTTSKRTLTFTSSGALAAGTIELSIDGFLYPITVTSGMTLAQAVTNLNDWNTIPSSWSNAATKGATRANTIELNYIGTASSVPVPTITFNGGTTGMSMTTNVLSSTTGRQDYYFNSLLLSDWNTSSKWDATNGTTCYPAFMGVLEYLKDKFPLAEIVVWGVQWLSVSNTPSATNSYMVETFAGSGVYTRNIHRYFQDASVIAYLKSKEAMSITAEYYNCRFIDVDANCGINIFNMFDGYYAQNDLHPLPLGYQKWGETLAKLY